MDDAEQAQKLKQKRSELMHMRIKTERSCSFVQHNDTVWESERNNFSLEKIPLRRQEHVFIRAAFPFVKLSQRLSHGVWTREI